MDARRWTTATVLGAGLMFLAPATASAEPPPTPGQNDVQGCRENGQAVAGLAQNGRDFGQTAADNTPIASVNAVFFDALCSER